ncbi:MAG: phosphatidate cytidylyltransferase [Alphaproteobacteria bacterium]|nr:phosphatidate cytidylyltransferase [Alphaproteobacteria bacterium]
MLSRLLAALVGLAIILPALIWGGPIAADIVVGLVLLIGIDEYAGMAFPERRAWALAGLVPVGLGFYLAVIYGPPGSVMATSVLGALLLMVMVLFRREPVDDAADAVARLVLGVVWIPALLVFLPLVRRVEHGIAWIFLVLAITWLGDTGGYFAGRFFGKHKLYPKVSPKKTWEGVAGGVALAVVGAFIVRAVGLPDLTVAECVALGVVLDLLGVVGDLVESLLKRSFGVKDSGWIMPGHGGILDRIDGLLFTVPVLYLYLWVSRGV